MDSKAADSGPDRPLLVVGAGPVGLTAAIGLARGGAPVRLIERAPAASRRSKALLVWPRTLEVLDAIGAGGAERERRSLPVAGFHYYSCARTIARIGFDSRTRPVILPQPEVEDLLTAAAEKAGVRIERDVELLDLVQQEDRVRVRLSYGGEVSESEYAYVLGADGAGSTVREQLGLGFDGLTYPNTFMLADVRVDGSPDHDSVHYYCSPKGVLVLIGLPGGRFRVFTSAPADFRPSGEPEADLAALQRMVDLRGPGGLHLYDPDWTSTFAVHARHAERYRVGRVFLAGDAAHIHSPAGGQGLNTGVTDAHNLAWKLAAVWHGHAPAELLDTYELERTHVAQSVVRQADLQTRAWLLRSRISVAARDLAARTASATGLFNRRYIPWLAGLRTRYQEGAMVPGPSGRGVLKGFTPGALAPDFPVFDLTAADPGMPVMLRPALSSTSYTLLLIGRPVADGSAPPLPEYAPGVLELRRLGRDRVLMPPEPNPGGAFEAVALIRPDGHVAAIGTAGDHPALTRYLAARLRQPAAAPSPSPRAPRPAAHVAGGAVR